MDESFFDESHEQSIVKSTIVSKYFMAWAMVIIQTQKTYNKENKIAYIDLFAGPGRYKDGTLSTPMLILEKAIQNPDICDRLITIFNDKDEENTHSLQQAINELNGVDKLKYAPKVYSNEVGENIVLMFENMKLVPTLFFVDPWGYKGLSLRLVNSVIKDWGCDCIFFFNYNRINMGLHNPMIKEHMDCLFEISRADELRKKLQILNPQDRELMIIEELCKAIRELGPQYVLPFRFKSARGTRTSHHLIFVSKNFTGYEKMKEIMAKESSSKEQGVPSFEYNPADIGNLQLNLLSKLASPLSDLGDMLLDFFAGRTLTMYHIYEEHNVDRPFIKSNYKETLLKLEESGKIKTEKHRKNTFGDKVKVTFPTRSQKG